jgi:hypothetical protein
MTPSSFTGPLGTPTYSLNLTSHPSLLPQVVHGDAAPGSDPPRRFNDRLAQLRMSRHVPRIEFLDCAVYVCNPPCGPPTAYLSEPLLDAERFRKWNDNAGGVDGIAPIRASQRHPDARRGRHSAPTSPSPPRCGTQRPGEAVKEPAFDSGSDSDRDSEEPLVASRPEAAGASAVAGCKRRRSGACRLSQEYTCIHFKGVVLRIRTAVASHTSDLISGIFSEKESAKTLDLLAATRQNRLRQSVFRH